jgi:hypothetical protein
MTKHFNAIKRMPGGLNERGSSGFFKGKDILTSLDQMRLPRREKLLKMTFRAFSPGRRRIIKTLTRSFLD